MSGRRVARVAILVGMLTVVPPVAAQPVPRVDPARCPALAPLEEALTDRTATLPVPMALAGLIGADRDRLAIATLAGGVVCVDARPIARADAFTVGHERRFLAFRWSGYEADGYLVVDRAGSGQVIETGVPPVFSPSGRRFAAVQQSEAAFGGLEGFGVWQLDSGGVRRLALHQDIPRRDDWRIDGWSGDDCIDLSGLRLEGAGDPPRTPAKLRRDRFVARPVGAAWVLAPSDKGCRAASAAEK